MTKVTLGAVIRAAELLLQSQKYALFHFISHQLFMFVELDIGEALFLWVTH